MFGTYWGRRSSTDTETLETDSLGMEFHPKEGSSQELVREGPPGWTDDYVSGGVPGTHVHRQKTLPICRSPVVKIRVLCKVSRA